MEPNNPSDWAEIAATADQSEGAREQAWRNLIPTIEKIASQVSRTFPAHVRGDVEQSAVSHVWQKFNSGLFTSGRQFNPWCRKVLFRLAIDVERRRGPLIPAQFELTANSSSAEQPTGEHELVERFRLLRDALDAMDWPAEKASPVDYRAVLLLELRLALDVRFARARDGGWGEPSLDGRGEIIATYLPWHEAEECLPIRVELPALRVVWTAIAARFDQPPHYLDGAALADLLSSLTGAQCVVTPDVWSQWKHRAKELARRQTATETWRELFAALLPSRQRSGGERGPQGGEHE